MKVLRQVYRLKEGSSFEKVMAVVNEPVEGMQSPTRIYCSGMYSPADAFVFEWEFEDYNAFEQATFAFFNTPAGAEFMAKFKTVLEEWRDRSEVWHVVKS